jgi:serine/threonine protein kinase
MNSTIGNRGTPIYQSPEQFSGEDSKSYSGTPSDIYSFGCILYEIIFEIYPWELG